jgi:hypothetical protein
MAFSKIDTNGLALDSVDNTILDVAGNYAFTGTVSGAGGITEADQWRLDADVSTTSANVQTLVTNWERNDNAGFGYIGSGMSHSSGTFTFPSTGKYLIEVVYGYRSESGGIQYQNVNIQTTTNNSAYSEQTETYTASQVSSVSRNVGTSTHIFDVTDTSNCKVRLYYFVEGTASLKGSSTKNATNVKFIRLGDT